MQSDRLCVGHGVIGVAVNRDDRRHRGSDVFDRGAERRNLDRIGHACEPAGHLTLTMGTRDQVQKVRRPEPVHDHPRHGQLPEVGRWPAVGRQRRGSRCGARDQRQRSSGRDTADNELVKLKLVLCCVGRHPPHGAEAVGDRARRGSPVHEAIFHIDDGPSAVEIGQKVEQLLLLAALREAAAMEPDQGRRGSRTVRRQKQIEAALPVGPADVRQVRADLIVERDARQGFFYVGTADRHRRCDRPENEQSASERRRPQGRSGANPASRWTTRPSSSVSRTRAVRIASGGASSRSGDSTTTSARLPGDSEPRSFSSNAA